MSIWKRELTLAECSKLYANTMIEHVGIEFIEIGDDFLKAKMPVDHRTVQPFNILHGGASCVLAETAASIAANFCVDEAHYCAGAEINTSHIKMVPQGRHVIGTAKPLHIGRTSQVWEILIHDDAENLISVTRLRLAVLKRT